MTVYRLQAAIQYLLQSLNALLQSAFVQATLPCRQQAIDNLNMLLQDPRPLEERRDDLAQVEYSVGSITIFLACRLALTDKRAICRLVYGRRGLDAGKFTGGGNSSGRFCGERS